MLDANSCGIPSHFATPELRTLRGKVLPLFARREDTPMTAPEMIDALLLYADRTRAWGDPGGETVALYERMAREIATKYGIRHPALHRTAAPSRKIAA